MEKQKKIPSLRFPEFATEWEKYDLGEISSWASGGTPSKDNSLYWNGNIPWISAASMRGIEYFDSERKITIEGLKVGSRLALKGNLLILVRGSMLFNKIPIGITLRDVAFNQDVKSIDIFAKNSTIFILYWFISSESIILNLVTGTGIGAGKLDLADLKNLTVYLPTLPEQTKIATFLTTIDDRLNQLKQKKTLLEKYKEGVMQKIFEQEIRFKDENDHDFPDWELKTLAEIGSIYQPKTISQTDLTTEGFDVYGANGIIGKYSKFNHEYSQIAITCRGNTCGTVNLTKPNSWITGNAMVINLDSNVNVVKMFLYFQLSNTNFDYLITGSGQPQITGEIKKHKILIACKAEQTKIANFLSAIDEMINQFSNQIGKTEQYKKGLLQQMFL